MEVLDTHKVTDDLTASTDWTTLGARILEAATIATAIHLHERTYAGSRREHAGDPSFPGRGWNGEISGGVG